MTKPYCGFKEKPPKGRALGARRYCKSRNQLRRFGRIAIVAPNNHIPGNHHTGPTGNNL